MVLKRENNNKADIIIIILSVTFRLKPKNTLFIFLLRCRQKIFKKFLLSLLIIIQLLLFLIINFQRHIDIIKYCL